MRNKDIIEKFKLLEDRVEELEGETDIIFERLNMVYLKQYDSERDVWRKYPIKTDVLIKSILKHLGIEALHNNDFILEPVGTARTLKEDSLLKRQEDREIPEER